MEGFGFEWGSLITSYNKYPRTATASTTITGNNIGTFAGCVVIDPPAGTSESASVTGGTETESSGGAPGTSTTDEFDSKPSSSATAGSGGVTGWSTAVGSGGVRGGSTTGASGEVMGGLTSSTGGCGAGSGRRICPAPNTSTKLASPFEKRMRPSRCLRWRGKSLASSRLRRATSSSTCSSVSSPRAT